MSQISEVTILDVKVSFKYDINISSKACRNVMINFHLLLNTE